MASELKHTVKPSGGDFTNLAAAFDHLVTSHANLVTADVYATIEISGAWSSADVESVEIAGLTTDATRYLRIYTDAANRASLGWNTGKYILSKPGSNQIRSITCAYVYIDGLQIGLVDGNQGYGIGTGALPDGANKIVISNCVLKGPGTSENQYFALQNWGDYANMYVYNTLIYGMGTTNVTVAVTQYNTSHPGSISIGSCTIIGADYGIARDHGTITAKNVYAGGAGTNCYYGTIGKTNCASSDATADGTDPLTGVAVSTTADATHAGFTNVTPGSEDFHIKAGSPLIGTGVDTSGDAAPMNFVVDIDGDSRV